MKLKIIQKSKKLKNKNILINNILFFFVLTFNYISYIFLKTVIDLKIMSVYCSTIKQSPIIKKKYIPNS